MSLRRLFVGKRLEANVVEVGEVNYVDYSFQRREALRTDEAFLGHVHYLWDVVAKDTSARVHEAGYLDLFARIAYVLVTESTPASARALAQADWDYDAHGRDCMHYTMFVDAVFEICDLFCPYTDSHEYCVLLMDLRRAITTVDLDETMLQATPVELHAKLKDVATHHWRPMTEIKKLSAKTIGLGSTETETLQRHRNGDWITGFALLHECRALSFKALLCAMHVVLYGNFSQKLHTPGKGQLESEYRLYQAKQPPPGSSVLRDKDSDTSLLPRPAASANRIPVMTDALRAEVWDPAVAKLLMNVAARPAICVVGPPRSGKTRLAQALAAELGLRYFSIPSVLDVLAKAPPVVGEAASTQLFATLAAKLRAGLSVSRDDAVSALLYYVAETVQGGQGFLLDDIYPHDAWGSDAFLGITFTHVVALYGTHANCKEHVTEMAMCPKRRVVYSARDLAQFSRAAGFADVYVERVAPPPVVVVPPPAEDNDGGDEEDKEDDDGDDGAPPPPPSVDVNAPYRVPPPSLDRLSQRYALPPNQDRCVNVGTMWLKTLDTAFAQSEKNLIKSMASAPPDLQLLRILFHQSPTGILHCALSALTAVRGEPPIVSRLPPSLTAIHVDLPADVAGQPRSEQIRWLLYGDWSPFFDDGAPLAPLKHLVPPGEPRLLSVFRGFCPVARLRHELGHPSFAVLFSGCIYLLSSDDAMRAFMRDPPRHLEPILSSTNQLRLPAYPLPQKVWVISSTMLWPAAFSVASVAAALATTILHVPAVDPTQLLAPSFGNYMAYESMLREGKAVPHAQLAKDMLHYIATTSMERWVAHGLPVDDATHGLMKELSLWPDMVLVLEPPPEDAAPPVAKDYATALASLLKLLVDDTGIPVTRCAVDAAASQDDVLAAIHRLLDPWNFNRVDGDDDGYVASAPPLSPVEEESRKVWGACGPYCPVTYATARLWRTVPGKKEFTSFVDQRLYQFAGAAEKAAFDRNPRRYIPRDATTVFRPIVLLLGVANAGRRSIALALQAALGATIFDTARVHTMFMQLVAIEKFNAGMDGDEAADLDEALQLALYVACMQREFDLETHAGAAPYVVPGFGPTASRLPTVELLTACLERKWFPLVVVPLQLDQTTAVARKMASWVYTPPKGDDDDEDAPDNEDAKEGWKERKTRLLADEAAAREEETARVVDAVAAELETYTNALQHLADQGAKLTAPVNAARGPQRVVKDVLATLHANGLAKLGNFFCAVDKLPLARMQALVAAGYLTMGHHGPYCPVQRAIRRRDSVEQVCVTYRDRIYFPSQVDAFAASPSKYACATATQKTRPPLSCAVIGAPCAGRTTLAKGLAAAFGYVYISAHDALKWVDACQRGTTLHAHIREFKQGDGDAFDMSLVNDAVALQCIVARIRSFECQTRGWVLDGYPTSVAQAHAWDKASTTPDALPATVLCLDSSVDDLLRRRCPISGELLKRMALWRAARLPLLISYVQTYGSGYVKLVPTAHKSTWKVLAEATALLDHVVDAHATYWQALASHHAAPAADVRLAQTQLQLHPLAQHRCPVGLARGLCVDTTAQDRTLLAEYEQYLYFLGIPETLAAFLREPAKTIAALKPPQPVLDVGVGAVLCHGLHVPMGFQGYCPVTYKEGAGPCDWRAIRKGSKYIVAALNQTIYCFVSHAAKRRFLLDPAAYSSLELPTKLPPLVTDAQAHLDVTIPGKLEQALSRVTEEALVALGSERLKFPGVAAKASAVMYVALLLKTKKKFSNHDQSLSADQVRALLHNYVQDCRLGQEIKELTAPVGSAVKGVRSMREKGDSTDLQTKNARFDAILHAPAAIFRAYATRALEK
ncbi:Aste57867_25199 [Aphanomyces stellatus]|uniref:Aste57867_25199 protein n=1 Tax=Aphanomyces stellatus TaxID=120398 RepID=A0A485LSH2_9STRA|nr:hypothetical protein As57867_025121 [Aphanomyces stellatus]VFU01826.1 Aste57867_25199 [Aphanomyces stellatus]